MPRTPSVADLYRTRYQELVRLAHALTHDRVRAEDVVQEAFTRLLQQESAVRPTGRTAWLKTVVVRLAYDVSRDSRRQVPLPDPEIRHETGPSSETVVMEQWDVNRLRAALDQLPPRDREALLLRHAGYRYREVAARIGVDADSVGMVLLRALRKLKQAYEDPADPSESPFEGRMHEAHADRPRWPDWSRRSRRPHAWNDLVTRK
jgi:RNA polymerase sigma factor (sigma-70 family)